MLPGSLLVRFSGLGLEMRSGPNCWLGLGSASKLFPGSFLARIAGVGLENASTLLPAAELLGVNFKPGSGNNSK